MSVKEIYELLLKAKRPIDFFGKVSDESELKTYYRKYAKLTHPDIANGEEYIANEAFSLLNKLYHLGLDELEQCIYETVDPI